MKLAGNGPEDTEHLPAVHIEVEGFAPLQSRLSFLLNLMSAPAPQTPVSSTLRDLRSDGSG